MTGNAKSRQKMLAASSKSTIERSWLARLAAYPHMVWSALFIVAPLMFVAYFAFTDSNGNFTFENIQNLTNYGETFVLSVFFSLIATVVCLLIGYPAAYFISRSSEKIQSILIMVITIPTWINALVRTYAWIGLLSEGGLIQQILKLLGLGEVELLYTEGAVLIGMVYNFVPFMILQINSALCKMDPSLLEAAADLGASKVETFKKVTFPLSLPGVINGITLVFLPAVSSFFIPKLLGGGQYFLIGNLIENQFITAGEWNFGSAISMIMAIIMMLMMMLVKKVEIRNNGGKEEE